MQCTGISVFYSSNDQTLEQFIKSPQAETPRGQLVINLVDEHTWSDEYKLQVSFDTDENLQLSICHKTFLPDSPLVIPRDTGLVLSVQGVERAIRAHIRGSQLSIENSIRILQDTANNLQRVFDRIDTDKARAAIDATFPKEFNLVPIVSTDKELYAFHHSNDNDEGPIFVARKVDGEFTGGAARINCSVFRWFQTENGMLIDQRIGMFWATLAMAFAARKLRISEKTLYCINVCTNEKPFGTLEGSVPTSVQLGIVRKSSTITVKFEDDGLPTKAYVNN